MLIELRSQILLKENCDVDGGESKDDGPQAQAYNTPEPFNFLMGQRLSAQAMQNNRRISAMERRLDASFLTGDDAAMEDPYTLHKLALVKKDLNGLESRLNDLVGDKIRTTIDAAVANESLDPSGADMVRKEQKALEERMAAHQEEKMRLWRAIDMLAMRNG